VDLCAEGEKEGAASTNRADCWRRMGRLKPKLVECGERAGEVGAESIRRWGLTRGRAVPWPLARRD